jgi:hypothetical protein
MTEYSGIEKGQRDIRWPQKGTKGHKKVEQEIAEEAEGRKHEV